MTAEEIRALIPKPMHFGPLPEMRDALFEIAAQLAEQNELLRSMQIHIVPKIGQPVLVGLRVGVHEMRP